MAWDLAFDIQWSQRIEKEEVAVLNGLKRQGFFEREEKHHRSRRSRSHTGTPGSGTLSAAGGRTLGSKSQADLDAASARSSSSQQSEEYKGLEGVPEHLKAFTRFPVVDKDLMTCRVKRGDKGEIPVIRMHPQSIKAMWWPGRGVYTKYHPEFTFVERPEWTPEDILKDDGRKRR